MALYAATEEFDEWREKNAPEYCLPHFTDESPLDDWRKFLTLLKSQPSSPGMEWGIRFASGIIAKKEAEARGEEWQDPDDEVWHDEDKKP
jgi:hypothetical protein